MEILGLGCVKATVRCHRCGPRRFRVPGKTSSQYSFSTLGIGPADTGAKLSTPGQGRAKVISMAVPGWEAQKRPKAGKAGTKAQR